MAALVSVIIATYKRFDEVYAALQSVLDQDYPRMELIVADDGSGNFPKAQIDAYIRQHARDNLVRVETYSNPENYGTVRSMNIAHRKAKGDYSVELAGDDQFYSAHTISMITERMEKTGCGVLSSSRLVVDENGKPRYYLPHRIHRRRLSGLDRPKQYSMMVSGQFYAALSGSALAFREDAFRSLGGYDEKYVLWEDGPFLEKYLRNNKIEMAYDIVSIRYRLGGISTGTVHPKLAEDGKLYNRTDRICRLGSLAPFYRRLTLFNIGRKKADTVRERIGNVRIMVYKLFYKLDFLLGEAADRIVLRFRHEKK